MAEKLKVALHWLASCGGCEVAVVDVDEKILDVVALMDILFWPVALDGKYSDIKAMEDKYLDIAIINGGVRTSEQEEHAKLFRAKAKVVVAFGSCACTGGVPGLANATTKDAILDTVYRTTASTTNEAGTRPQQQWVDDVSGVTLTLPTLHEEVKPLHEVIDVDYYVPGCPPVHDRILDLVGIAANFAQTGELPPKGAIVAGTKAVCEECKYTKEEKHLTKVVRVHEAAPEPDQCLLEQGYICMGPATRGGCGAVCMEANMPCRGCYGKLENVDDQGLKMLSALASVMGVDDEVETSFEEAQALIDKIHDPLGTFYRFGLPVAIMNRAIPKEVK